LGYIFLILQRMDNKITLEQMEQILDGYKELCPVIQCRGKYTYYIFQPRGPMFISSFRLDALKNNANKLNMTISLLLFSRPELLLTKHSI